MKIKFQLFAMMLVGILLSTNFVWGTTATYSVTSTSAVSATNAPAGSSSSYANTYSTNQQTTAGNTATLTLTSLGSISISNITLSMHSNAGNGSGCLSYSTDGGSSWTYLVGSSGSGLAFSNAKWNGSYTTSWVDISKNVDLSSVTQLKVRIEVTNKSLYCRSFSITYTAGSTKTLVYDANGATGGSVPTDATAYNVGDKATVKGNTGSLYKIGHTFAGWTDNSAGTGTVYTSGDKFTIASSGNTLYAKWTNTYAGDEFSLVEDLSDLSAGSKIVILNAAHTYAISTSQGSNNRTAIGASADGGFTMSNSDKTVTLKAATTVQVISLEDLATPASNTYQFNVEDGYLYAAGSGSGNNYLRTQTTNNANGHWLIGLTSGTFSVVAQGTNTNNTLKRNSSSAFFSCYASGQENVLIYVKDEGTKYAITWANGGHGTAPTSPTSAAKVTMPELSASGWQHTGWKANVAVTNASTSATISAGTLIENGTRVQLGAATTFTAQWKQICATPTFSPAANTYNAAQTVSISCDSPSGTTIRYTTDGTNPTSSSGTVYSSAISVSVTTTIKAIAYKSGCADSEVASATYTLKCATPTFSVAAGTKHGAQSVTLSCATEGATIYYTTDGSTPTSGSTPYSSAISVTESQTIKAIAVKSGWSDSNVASAAYTIQYQVTWTVNGDDDDITPTWVNCGSKPVFPSNPAACDATSTTFIGWTQTPWANPSKIDQAAIDAKTTDATKVYTSASAMPNVVGNIEYHAVWAAASVTPTTSYAAITSGLSSANYVIAYSYNGGTQIVLKNTADDANPTTMLEGYALSLSSSKYSNPAATYIWALQQQADGSYYIYNANVNKYVNATTTALTLSTTPTKFTITYDETNSRWTIQIKDNDTYYMHGYVNSTAYDFRVSTSGSGNKYRVYLYKQESTTTYSDYITSCCNTPTLAFAASPYAVIRQDIQGASTTTWAEVDVTFTSNNTTGTISATTYTDSKTVYSIAWGTRGTTGGSLCATNHAYFEVLTQPSGETPGTGKFHVKTTSGQTGQGTYRIAITQASTDEEHGNFCETTVYGFVDVTLRDKFVDAVNGNGTVNKDGHGAQLATPLLSEFGTQVEDECHDEGRKLKGWIKETDLSDYSGDKRVTVLDSSEGGFTNRVTEGTKIIAPGTNVTMSGVTWYAVWAYEK